MMIISEKDRTILLRLARESIERAVRKLAAPDHPHDAQLALAAHAGVFVTIYVDDRLRGCIGSLDEKQTVQEALKHAATSAATNDGRFRGIASEELERLSFDISVLEPMEPIASETDIVIGRHGLFIEYLSSRGLLLPQVASERNWSPRQFLEAVCDKAGLPRNAWRDSHAKCFRFGASKIHGNWTDRTNTKGAQ